MKNPSYNHQVSILEWLRDSDRRSGKVEISMITEGMLLLTQTYSENISATKRQRKAKVLQLSRDEFDSLLTDNFVSVICNKKKSRFYVQLKKEI